MPSKPKPKPSNYTYRDSFPSFTDPAAFSAGDPLGYLISWSGGRDSCVVMEMALEVTQDADMVRPFIMSLLPEMDYIAFWREFARKRWGVTVLEFPHWAYSWFRRRGTMRLLAEPTFPRILPADIERVARHETGLNWIGYGYKAIDSLQRRGMMNKWRYGVCYERAVFAPLKDWTKLHVRQFLERKRLGQPLDPAYQSRGIDMSPECMHWLRQYWPDDHRRMTKEFPLAVAQADRWEAILQTKKAKGTVHMPNRGGVGGKRLAHVPKPENVDGFNLVKPSGDGSFPDQLIDHRWEPADQLDDMPFTVEIADEELGTAAKRLRRLNYAEDGLYGDPTDGRSKRAQEIRRRKQEAAQPPTADDPLDSGDLPNR